MRSSAHLTPWFLGIGLFLIAQVLVPAPQLAAQERPFDISPCEVVAHPDTYREALIRVEGFLTISPGDFTIHGECDDAHGQIWLEFGGDQPNPLVPRNHEQWVHYKEEVMAIPLTKDRDYERLLQRITEAQKNGKPQMLRVIVTGRYFPGDPVKSGKSYTTRRGYGPGGCCSLLVISLVDRVADHLEQPADFSALPQDAHAPAAKGCVFTELPLLSQGDAEKLQDQALDDGFEYLHSPETSAAHFLAQAAGVPSDPPIGGLSLTANGVDSPWYAYAWRSPAGATYSIIVNKPYWLLSAARNGNAIIWVPKQIVRTDCHASAKKK